MAELRKDDDDLAALSSTTDTLTGLPFPTENQNPHAIADYDALDQIARALAPLSALQVYKDGTLTFGVRAGQFYNVAALVNYAGASDQALGNNATNYIYLTVAGTLTVNTTGFPVLTTTPHVPLAEIVTASGTYDVTDITDRRARALYNPAGVVEWDDIRITPGAFRFAGSADPTLRDWQPGASGATYRVYGFAKNDEVFASVQMPHSYIEGTDLEFHIHWTPADRGVTEDTNTVGWKVDHSIANVGAAFPASSTVDLSDACSGVDDQHEITSSVTVDGTGLTISHIIQLRIYRSDTGTDDTWVGATGATNPILLEFDIHYEKNSLGSDAETAKA